MSDANQHCRRCQHLVSETPADASPVTDVSSGLCPHCNAAAGGLAETPWQRFQEFAHRHFRVIGVVLFVLAPFGLVGEEALAAGGSTSNVLKFVGGVVVSWVVASLFLVMHLQHRKQTTSPGDRAPRT